MNLILPPAKGYPLANLAQDGARYVTGHPDTDHAGDDLRVGAADIGVPYKEAEPAAGGAAHRAGAAAARNHLGCHHHGPGNTDADGCANDNGGQYAGQNDATEDVKRRRGHRSAA